MARKLTTLAPILLALAVLVSVLGSGTSRAATPANPNDPCATSGRDTCGTTGVGAYHQYAYGLRWFGDYRNAIPGVSGPTFCIDLNFWFPGKSYRYVQHTTAGLRSKAGTAISAATLEKISYAIWNDGRTNTANQQSAVMLYVHGQIGDAPAAQTAGNSIGPAVNAIYKQVTADANRYAGPYTMSVSTPSSDIAGESTSATIKVVSAAGNAVPDVSFGLDISGAGGAPSTVTSGANGTAKVTLTPDDATHGLSVKATATGLAADAPILYTPTSGASAANGQRLVAPASQTLTASETAKVSLITPTISSAATPASLTVGSTDADAVTLAGLPSDYNQMATVNVYGPASDQTTISCTGTPVATMTFTAANGTTHTSTFTPTEAGWYGYQVVLGGTSSVAATTSPCAPVSESFDASLATPTVSTQATPGSVNFGSSDADSVTVTGLPSGETPQATVNVYGPAASPSAIDCTSTPVASATFTASNATITTPSVTPTQVGYYGYQIVLPATSESDGVSTPCAPAEESFEVTTSPTVATQVSAASATPGTSLSDTLNVTGLQGQSATVTADLYGPFASASATNCTGTPVWRGTVAVNGDGTYETAATTLSTPGYYVYHESIAQTGFVEAATSKCSDSAETTVATGTPTITTRVSDAVVTPGSTLQDHAAISGLGRLPAPVHVVLWGPYTSAAAVNCTGTPAWSGSFTAKGDGSYLTAKATVRQAGYYVYQESIGATSAYSAVTTTCANSAETSVAKPAPQVVTEASSAVVVPGSSVLDHIRVSGVGSTPVKIDVSLYGPFAALSSVSCGGTPYSTGTVNASGNGTVNSPSTVIARAGFYVYRETLEGTGLVPSVTTACATPAETVLGRPEIITGPGVARFTSQGAALSVPAGEVPTNVSISSLNIAAPVSQDAISLNTGQMEIPANIHHVGWWQDGAAPASRTGTTLLFGHINYTGQGNGAFYELAQAGDGKQSITGDLVTVRTAGGKTYTYRIVRVQRMLKAQLPTSIFTQAGGRKLVMVTCGGALDAKTHHYVDNIVVTAVPA
jgi:hypothetical protein